MRLKEKRIAAGLTQQGLSEQSGVAREIITRIETNKVTPELATIIKLSKALGCSLDELVADPEDSVAETG